MNWTQSIFSHDTALSMYTLCCIWLCHWVHLCYCISPNTCEPSLEGGATPPYPPMLQLRLLLNWPLWCGHDHKKLVFKFPFLSICDEQCALDHFYSMARKNLSNCTLFLELVLLLRPFWLHTTINQIVVHLLIRRGERRATYAWASGTLKSFFTMIDTQ